MPRIQVLEPGYSFSSELGKALGRGGEALGQGLSQGIQQHLQQKQNKKQLAAFTPFLKNIGLQDDEIQSFIDSGMPPELGLKAIEIHAKKKQEDATQNAEYGKIIDNLEGMLDESGVGLSGALKRPFSEDAREHAANFQAQSTALLGLAQKVALKRGITNQREFQSFMDRTIPNKNDSIGTAKGKLKALKNYLKEVEGGSSSSSQKSVPKELEKGASFEALPKASDSPNAIFRKGNKRYRSDGKTWKEIK